MLKITTLFKSYKFLFVILGLSAVFKGFSQDTLGILRHQFRHEIFNTRIPSGFLLPSGLVSYGIISLESPTLQNFGKTTMLEIREHNLHFSSKLDNYLQFSPVIFAYGLDLAGVKPKNNLRDRTMILGLSTIISTGLVIFIKQNSGLPRPDGSANNTFPSGHTATAFNGAEFLYEQYKGASPLYGYMGYMTATTTGILRMYNNKHHLSDVIMGAGIGIISTKASAYLFPRIKKIFIKH